MNLRFFTIGALLLGCDAAPTARADLAARLELYKEQVVVGEPLLITAVVTNQGKSPVVSTLAVPSHFQRLTSASFVIRDAKKGTVVVRLRWDRYAVVQAIPPESLTDDELKEHSVIPGASVKARKALCLRTESGEYLGPGDYTIEAGIDFTPFAATAAKTPFTIQPVAKGDEELLRIFSPQEAESLLKHSVGSTPDLRSRRDELRKSFPQAPHRLYLEYALLRRPILDEEVTFRPAIDQYIKDYPKSPFIDELLRRRAAFELTRQNYQEALGDLKQLFKEYPDSVHAGESHELLKRVGGDEADALLKSLKSRSETK